MTEAVGSTLKAAREARGLSISEVAQSLKFAPRQLEALEQERFDLLPGGTFVRGMVRSYARLLKLEADPLVEAVGGRFQAPDAGTLAARYSQPVPFSDSARRSTMIYLGLSLVVLAAAGVFAYQWMRERTAPKKPVAAPVVRTPPKAAPRPVVESAPVPVMEKPVVEKKAEPPKKPEALAKPASGVHRLVLRMEREAWIEVRDGAERLLISSLNAAGTERVVQGRPPFSLVIGNAQHVRVIYDDRLVDLQPYVKVEVARLTLQ